MQIRFLASDRDGTLLGNRDNKDDWYLINEATMVPLLRAVSETMPWALISSGAHADIEADLSICMLGDKGLFQGVESKLPAYFIGRGLSVLTQHMSVDDTALYDKQKFKVADIFSGVVESELLPSSPLNEQGRWELKNIKIFGDVTLSPDTLWTSQIGHTTVKIKTGPYVENFEAYTQSKSKIMALLTMLDQAHLGLILTPELQALGFEEINTPANYKSIYPQEILFLDDEPKICDYMKLAGMKAIIADTEDANQNRQKTETRDTYVRQLIDALPFDTVLKYLQYKVQTYRDNENVKLFSGFSSLFALNKSDQKRVAIEEVRKITQEVCVLQTKAKTPEEVKQVDSLLKSIYEYVRPSEKLTNAVNTSRESFYQNLDAAQQAQAPSSSAPAPRRASK
jgi:hypothetical protein